jgi:hypothetical protein
VSKPPDPVDSQSPDLLWELYRTGCRSAQEEGKNADAYLRLAASHEETGQHAKALSVLKDGLERCQPATAEIAARLPTARFLFVAPNEPVAAEFLGRLSRAFSSRGLNVRQYCAPLPWMNALEYWNLNLLCDVCDVFLDTMGWSAGITTFEGIACDLPVVTMPGKFMRGRQSAELAIV